MKEVIVKLTSDRIKIKGGEYMQDIVRCKECKHWTNGDDVYGICYRCPNTRQMRFDDFCSYGEPNCSGKPNNCEPQTETSTNSEKVQLMDEPQTDCAWK